MRDVSLKRHHSVSAAASLSSAAALQSRRAATVSPVGRASEVASEEFDEEEAVNWQTLPLDQSVVKHILNYDAEANGYWIRWIGYARKTLNDARATERAHSDWCRAVQLWMAGERNGKVNTLVRAQLGPVFEYDTTQSCTFVAVGLAFEASGLPPLK